MVQPQRCDVLCRFSAVSIFPCACSADLRHAPGAGIRTELSKPEKSQEPISERKMSSGQRCQTDRSILIPSNLASVKVYFPSG